MIITVYDSFDEGPAGNGHWVYDEVSLQLGYPQVMWRGRMVSQAGQNNWGFVTNNMPSAALPLAGSMHGTNDVWFWLGVSGNGGFASTANVGWYTSNLQYQAQFPMTNWSYHGYFTNDWPWSTNGLHWTGFGDSTYYGDAAGNSPVNAYSLIASNALWAFRIPFIDSTAHTSYETNQFNSDTNLAAGNYYHADNTPPDLSHPRRDNIQFVRHLLDYQQMGGETNIFSCVLDWNSSTVDSTATNHIAISGVSRTAWVYSCTARADRLGGPIEIGDTLHTNDNRKAFAAVPALTNFFGEWTVLSNCPPGNFVFYLDSEPVQTNASVNGMLSNNWYHTSKGAWFRQKMAVLDGYRTVRDISTVNASIYVTTSYQKAFNTQIGNFWPSSTGAANYTASMLTYETPMETVDVSTFNAAQQTNHTLTVIWQPPAYLPFTH